MRTIVFPILLILISCNSNPSEKSILKELTVEEIEIAVENDTLFETHYELLERLRDSVMNSEVRIAKFGDVTYQEWSDFLTKVADTAYLYGLENQFSQQWHNKNKGIIRRVDSVAEYWTKYLKYNGFDITTFKKESMEPNTDLNTGANSTQKSVEIANQLPDYIDDYMNCAGDCYLEKYYIQYIAKDVLNVEIESYSDYFVERFKSHLIVEHGKLGELLLLGPIVSWEF